MYIYNLTRKGTMFSFLMFVLTNIEIIFNTNCGLLLFSIKAIRFILSRDIFDPDTIVDLIFYCLRC